MLHLVTGGAGFIGSHLVDQLVERGDSVRVFDNFSSGRKEFLSGHDDSGAVELFKGDLLDLESVKQAVQGVDMVWHLAANPDIRLGTRVTDTDLKQGTIATYNVVEAMRLAGVQDIAFSSSSVVYGEAEVMPTPEDFGPLFPISLYGASKLAGESYCQAFTASYGLHTAALRFANVYGPFSAHKNSAVHKFIKQSLDGEPIDVFGDGTQTRDFIYVDDICEAIVLASNCNSPGEAFHIATNTENSVLDLIEIINSVAKNKLKVIHHDRREGEAYRIRASIKKAQDLLGFTPQVSFAEGVKLTYQWFSAEKEKSGNIKE